MAEVKDGRYLIAKDIPLDPKGENAIKRGTEIYLTGGVFYINGVLLSPDYQKDFQKLFTKEATDGWNYVAPVKTKVGDSVI